ncbi:MAG TPA: tetratricopeptide repeat protein [Terriglobia bacterium]
MSQANLQSAKRFYEFGSFRIDVSEKLLFHETNAVPLTPKAFDTLLALVETPGHILEKDDLMKRVWPDTIVEENNLTQNISALRKALGQNAEERTYIETIPRRGYRFRATVSERWEEIPELIVRERTKSTVIVEEEEETDTRTGLWTRLSLAQFALIAAFLLLVAASTVYYVNTRSHGEEAGSRPSFAGSGAVRRPAVAVLGFQNLTGRPDAAWLSTAFSEMLTSELAAGEQLRAIPGEDVARLKVNVPLEGAGSLAPDTLLRIRDNLGTDYVVLGSYTDLGQQGGGRVRLDLRLQDASAGETLAAFAETGTESGLFDLVSTAGARLRQALKVDDVPRTEAAAVRAELPSGPEAAKLYADGLAKIRSFDGVGGRDLLEKAVAADPRFPLAHSALGTALSALGYDAQAREEAKKAFQLSGSLDRQERLVIEGRYRSVLNQWDRAAEVYRTLFGLFPDNLDYGISLATAQSLSGKGQDALATLAALRGLPAPGRDDPRIDMVEADWAESVSDFKREQASASRAADRGEALGADLLVARARLSEGTALWRLGQPAEALTALAGAEKTFASTGDKGGVAEALEARGEVLTDQGNIAEARQKYEQALEIRRQIGDEGGVASSLTDLAILKWQQSDFEGAKQMYDQALASFREIGDEVGVANTLNNLANIFYDHGEVATAKRMYEDSAAKFEGMGDKGGTAQELINIGLVFSNQGDLAGARAKYEQAIGICRQLGIKGLLATALSGLGEVDLRQGNLAASRKSYEEAAALRRDLGEKGGAAESEFDLASLAIEEGHPANAQAALPAALDEVRREGQADDEAYGGALLARALLEEGKLVEADREARRALPLAEKSQNAEVRLMVATVAAQVEAASGEPQRVAKAKDDLMAVQSEAARLGLVDRQLEARFVLGVVDLKSKEPAARANLEQLQKEADEKGFGLIGRKARHALTNGS